MQNNFPVFETRFRDFYATFAEPDGSFAFAHRRKLAHTFHVCKLTERICAGSGISADDSFLYRLCALFHDVSRFDQYKRFKTFRDAISFDHGDRSAELLKVMPFLDGLSDHNKNIVIAAVQQHNKLRIAPGTPAEIMPYARMVRDADKLSILTIIYEFFAIPDDEDKSDPTIRLDLPREGAYTPEILSAVMKGGSVRYSDLRNVNDFIITLFVWVADLNYPESARIAMQDKLYEKLAELLPVCKETDEVIQITKQRLQALSERSL